MHLPLGIPHTIQSPGNAGPSAGTIAGGVIFVLIILGCGSVHLHNILVYVSHSSTVHH